MHDEIVNHDGEEKGWSRNFRPDPVALNNRLVDEYLHDVTYGADPRLTAERILLERARVEAAGT
jgi:hypothetical protein